MVKEMRKHWTNIKVATVIIIAILLTAGICLLSMFICENHFPPESDQWCTDEGEYYIGALDTIFYNTIEGGWTETYKDLALITINETYHVEAGYWVAGELYLFDNYEWVFTDYLQFPIEYINESNTPLVPLTCNDYGVTEELMFMSLVNVIANFEGNATVINFTISHTEQYVTMTQECDTPVNFFDPATAFITVGYFYGVEYTMECWIDFPPNQAIYLKMQIVSECHSGIPLFQSLILTTYVNGFGCTFCSIFSLKTIATSVLLIEV
jgi:hypothetical protein